ncbi:MAG: hypothetical protein M0Z82_07600 [Actinomycetota bacterium]|nr:hypothetical protein [Actinomycetota bacterium]
MRDRLRADRYAQLARIGKVVVHPKRIELLAGCHGALVSTTASVTVATTAPMTSPDTHKGRPR